ncbi:MAG: hypothetical protein ACLFQ5_00965 [Oceanicaulis sp.]
MPICVRLPQTCVILGTCSALTLSACGGVQPGQDTQGGAARHEAAAPERAGRTEADGWEGPQGEPPNNRIKPPHVERFQAEPFPMDTLPGAWGDEAGCRMTLEDGGAAAAAGCGLPALARWRADPENDFRINLYAADGRALGHALRLGADRMTLWPAQGGPLHLQRRA